jgi:hypothetical protein
MEHNSMAPCKRATVYWCMWVLCRQILPYSRPCWCPWGKCGRVQRAPLQDVGRHVAVWYKIHVSKLLSRSALGLGAGRRQCRFTVRHQLVPLGNNLSGCCKWICILDSCSTWFWSWCRVFVSIFTFSFVYVWVKVQGVERGLPFSDSDFQDGLPPVHGMSRGWVERFRGESARSVCMWVGWGKDAPPEYIGRGHRRPLLWLRPVSLPSLMHADVLGW